MLVAAVTALALMSVLALGLAETSALDARLGEKSLAALQAQALARSGVAVAAVVLAETDAAGGPDTLGAPWAVDVGRQPLGPGWVEVHVEDEARRLDLDAPELADAVPRLLVLLGLDPGLADTLADWADADDAPRPRGAEREWYLAQTPPLVPRNAPFASVGELALVRGIDAAVLTRLRPFVTVAGEHAVNPNTASREVLLAVVQDAAGVDRLLAARRRGAIVAEDVAALLPDAPYAVRLALVPRGQHYTVRAVGGVGALRRTVETTLSAPAGVEPEIVAWRSLEP
ncbi:MAG TPA: type II secretion system minor pseudopilin GspK [Candidatus Elarobacter sp.]|nr:type II secretion system minor pseudopilin GspK [Candidatus Elarobacter sp.]